MKMFGVGKEEKKAPLKRKRGILALVFLLFFVSDSLFLTLFYYNKITM